MPAQSKAAGTSARPAICRRPTCSSPGAACGAPGSCGTVSKQRQDRPEGEREPLCGEVGMDTRPAGAPVRVHERHAALGRRNGDRRRRRASWGVFGFSRPDQPLRGCRRTRLAVLGRVHGRRRAAGVPGFPGRGDVFPPHESKAIGQRNVTCRRGLHRAGNVRARCAGGPGGTVTFYNLIPASRGRLSWTTCSATRSCWTRRSTASS